MASTITFDRLVTGICDSVHWPDAWSHTQTTGLWPAFSHVKRGGSHLLPRLWQSPEASWAVTKYWSLILSLVCHPVFFPTVHQSIHPSIHPSVLLRFLNAPGITRWPKLKYIPPCLCVLVFLCVCKLWDCHKCQVGIYWEAVMENIEISLDQLSVQVRQDDALFF